ncbi:hypothetical protein HID58_094260 [Brassica napus]|uniref:Uncharacterized protein n=1 Tax=Brassica napus TaxID=3708 RepID=A0ABQ7X7Y0_BRANA|nr:hypothetical protein HID58_094260 [Brassica napus]
MWVSRQEGIGAYGLPDGGDAVFSGVGVRGEERGSLSSTTAGLCFWETVALLAPSSPAPASGRRQIIKASYFFRLLISHLKRLGMSVVVWSMVDGSDESTLIVFGECLARSSWDSDESAME